MPLEYATNAKNRVGRTLPASELRQASSEDRVRVSDDRDSKQKEEPASQ